MKAKQYEELYIKRKKKLRELHKRLKKTKKAQEIFHKLVASNLNLVGNKDDEILT